MNISDHAPLHLLHQAAAGTLATHSREPHEGFPYPSILPFAPCPRHWPVILVSRLAEHTRNLEADPRAGFLIAHAADGDVLNGQRASVLGRFERIEATPAVTARYLRYHADAARYLELGDFSFWTLRPERLRYIGGFGAMGWLEAAALDTLDPLDDDEETALLAGAARLAGGRDGLTLLGVDRHGVDLSVGGARTRIAFDAPKTDAVELETALRDCLHCLVQVSR